MLITYLDIVLLQVSLQRNCLTSHGVAQCGERRSREDSLLYHSSQGQNSTDHEMTRKALQEE